jgi:cobalt/nickel transport protein
VSRRRFLWAGLAIAVVLVVVASYVASSRPDGLTYVSEQTGFAHAGESRDLRTGPLAGLVGLLLVLAIGGGLFRLLRRPSDDTDGEG